MIKYSWYLFVDLLVLHHASVSNTNRLDFFVFVWISKSCPTLRINTHMIPHTALPAAARWHHSAHWVRQNGHWVRLRQEESREWEPMPGGRKGREREWKWEGCIIWNTVTAPTSCLFTWLLILSPLPFLHQSLHPPFTPSPNTHSHTHFIPVIVCTSHVIIPTPPYSSTASFPRLST